MSEKFRGGPVIVEKSSLRDAKGNLSSSLWAKRFQGSKEINDLRGTFREAVRDFIGAMTEAGIKVVVEATYRPPQRSYLMHWCWRIVKDAIDPATIPGIDGVDIVWVHSSKAASIAAARSMVTALSINQLRTAPALRSQHNLGLAIDMSISWTGEVTVKDANGHPVRIKTFPRTGMNRQLIDIGAGYGVKKFYGGARDIPHWSNNGR